MLLNDRVFITGITGLIGSRLADYLTKYNFKIWGCSRKAKKNFKYNLTKINLCNLPKLIKEIKTIKPNIIFHLAGSNDNSFSSNPYNIINNNVRSTNNLLRACEDIDEDNLKIIICSSVELTNNFSKLSLDSPYIFSKRYIEDIINLYNKRLKAKIILVRFGTVFGPCDSNSHRLIPSFFDNFKRNIVDLDSFSKVKQKFLFVDDAVKGLIHSTFSKSIRKKIPLYTFEGRQISSAFIMASYFNNNIIKNIPIKKITLPTFDSLKKKWKTTISIEEGLDYCIKYFKSNYY